LAGSGLYLVPYQPPQVHSTKDEHTSHLGKSEQRRSAGVWGLGVSRRSAGGRKEGGDTVSSGPAKPRHLPRTIRFGSDFVRVEINYEVNTHRELRGVEVSVTGKRLGESLKVLQGTHLCWTEREDTSLPPEYERKTVKDLVKKDQTVSDWLKKAKKRV